MRAAIKIAGMFLILLMMLLMLISSVAAIKTFHVQETELVKLRPSAVDPNQDKIIYYFTAPLDEKGEWQTKYGDAGEYNVTITASDGTNSTNKTILLIVDKKNRPSVLSENKITVKELQTVDLKSFVSDPDNDILTFKFEAPFDDQGIWKTNYGDTGQHNIQFQVSDGEFTQNFAMEIDVTHTNQAPKIKSSFSDKEDVITAENNTLDYFVKAEDADKNPLTYTWQWDGKSIGNKASGSYYLDFESSGNHILGVTVNDGSSSSSQEWRIHVDKTNRALKLALLPLTVKEGEKVSLNLPDTDEDGDNITYNFEEPLNRSGEWQTSFHDQGDYDIKISATDGEAVIEDEVHITVLDVDQAPGLLAPQEVNAWEGTPVELSIKSADVDGDNVTVSFSGAPADASYDNKKGVFAWIPSYDTVVRPYGKISDFFNRMRLEGYLLGKKTIKFNVTSCAKELCTTKEMGINVANVNRAPQITSPDNMVVEETEKVKIPAEAIDLDGDIVNYYFTSPAGKKSGSFETDYDSAGVQIVYLTATDGKLSETKAVTVTIKEKNRNPTLKVNYDDVIVNENQQFMVRLTGTDPDNDNLTFTLKNPPKGASLSEGIFLWAPGYNLVLQKTDSGWNNLVSNYDYLNKKFSSEKAAVWLEFAVSDGKSEIVHPVKVTVKNVNLAPSIVNFLPKENVTVLVGSTVPFEVIAKDNDYDNLTYEWSFGFNQEDVTGARKIERTYTSSGDKKVKVVVSDGRDSVEQEWKINVVDAAAPEVITVDNVIVPETVSNEEMDVPFTVRVYVVGDKGKESYAAG